MTPLNHCNAAKLNLRIRCHHFLDHVNWYGENNRKLDAMGMMENGEVESNKFLVGIGTMILDKTHFKNSLIYGLIMCVITLRGKY
jgi:hypothetical protein